MARRPRGDFQGSWHHVINRGIAKRPYFESRSDKRFFLAQLASEVRAGRIEVHAYSLLMTHFHLLVRSPLGEMSEAMRRVQCAYSRFFNRRRSRDGPLIRARFFSKRIDSIPYRRAVVRYIDANVLRAGIVRNAEEHEFGSARSYLSGRCPPWLSTSWVMGSAAKRSKNGEFNALAYRESFGPRTDEDLESLAQLIELRMASTREVDPLDDLVGATPRQVRLWMIRKARLADGMKIGLPVCGPSALRRALDRYLESEGEWVVEQGARDWRGSRIAWFGLLRELCSMPLAQLAKVGSTSVWCATRQVDAHRSALAGDRAHVAAVAEITREALAVTLPR